jgi:1,4-alpha-glucan branching enzyme
LYRDYRALHELDCSPNGFSWIDADDSDHSIYTYCRLSRDGELLIVVLNFTPVPRFDYRIGVPKAGTYIELLNSDAKLYGGSNIGNLGARTTQEVARHGRPHSLQLNIPPLGMLIIKPGA